MTTALPDGTQIADWGGFPVHEYLSTWNDQNLGRIAQHTFDRRNGGQNEDMGEGARITRVTMLFEGSQGFAACKKFIDLWRANKTRLFVHPIWGKFNATFIGIESGTLTVDSGANLYTVQGQFVESNINAATVANDTATVPTKAASAGAQIDAVQQTALSLLNTATAATAAQLAAVNSTIAAYSNTADAFATAALYAASNASPNAALPSLLASALTANAAAIVALRAATSDGPAAYDAVAACNVLAAILLDLGAAYLAQTPPLVEFVPGERTPLLAIANLWYPGDAINRLAQIQANNPTLRGVVVPCGFRLQMASA